MNSEYQTPPSRPSYSSVTDMLSNLGWRSLENRRTDRRLAMFYKIVYGLVAIPQPSYFEHPEVYTRHMHSLSYRQIHTSACYYKYFIFLYPLFFRTSYQLISIALVPDLDSFEKGVPRGGGGGYSDILIHT